MTDALMIEILGAILAVLFLVLAVRQHRACWIFCILSALLYILVFVEARLYVDAALQLFFIAGAVHGWRHWGAEPTTVEVRSWPPSVHLAIIGLGWSVGLLGGYILATHTDAAYPFVDTPLGVFSIIATWLQARKLLESWLYWIVVDVWYVALYLNKDLPITASLFAVYVVLAAIGFLGWYREKSSPQTI